MEDGSIDRKNDIRLTRRAIRIEPKEIRKHGKRDQPLWIKQDLPGANMIIEQWKSVEDRTGKLFPIGKWTAWKLIKEVTEGRYPHFFRLNRATKFAEHEKTSILDLKQWFGWVDPRTINEYLGRGGRRTRSMAERVR